MQAMLDVAAEVGAQWQCNPDVAGNVDGAQTIGGKLLSGGDRIGQCRLSQVSGQMPNNDQRISESGEFRYGSTKFTLLVDASFVWDHGWIVILAPADAETAVLLQPLVQAFAFLLARLRLDGALKGKAIDS